MPWTSRAFLALAASCAAAFVAIYFVVRPAGHTVDLDLDVATWIAAHRTGAATSIFLVVTWLGSIFGIIPIAALIGVYLYRRKGFDPVRWLAIASVGATALYLSINQFIDRPRPPLGLRLHEELGWSFPSGHSTQAAAFSVMAAVVIGAGRPRRPRVLLIVGALAVAAIVGCSRIYLCAHWTTDVLGGWSLGLCWVSLVLVARQWMAARSSRSLPPT